MLCYLRFPGRILQPGEPPPAALCAFVAEQLSLKAVHFGDYAERDQTRRAHLSDQFGPFHTNVIAATANEAPYVLDGLLYHQSSLVINEHYTDTGGFSDHVFA